MNDSTSSNNPMGRLVNVDLREVWQNEAQDFTPWVLANADRLSEALGINLELENAEHPVGNFSLDLIGTDLDTGDRVIIENQLEGTDHTHLGQIMTYVGGTDPKTIVWIAKNFREEHAAALQWLNEHTDEGINFYGVKVSTVRIDDSRPAPLFDLVVRPNSWEKRIRTSTSTSSDRSELRDRYVRFWTRFHEVLEERQLDWTSTLRKNTNYANWSTYSTGVNGVLFSLSFAGPFGERTLCQGMKAFRSEIYFGSSDATLNSERYESLENRRDELERLVGAKLSFEPLENKKACRIALYTPGSSEDEASWGDAIDFFIESQEKFRSALANLGGLSNIFSNDH